MWSNEVLLLKFRAAEVNKSYWNSFFDDVLDVFPLIQIRRIPMDNEFWNNGYKNPKQALIR